MCEYGRLEVGWKRSKIKIGIGQGEHETGLEMVTFTAEPVRFLPWMMSR